MKKANQRVFEGMYIFSAALSENARKKALEKITRDIENRGGEIHKIFDQGRKKLASVIRRHKEGVYFLLYFSVPPEAIKEMKQEYALNEDLLRYMVMRAESVPEKIEFKPLVQQ